MADALFYAELLQGFPVVVVQAVVWGDMDSYAHVNNVVYFRYFENARIEYLNRIGWSDLKHETGIGPILRDTQARFRLPLTYPDTIAIGARAVRVEADRLLLEHRIVSTVQGALVTEGTGTVVSYDYGAGKKAPIPEAVKQAIARLQTGQSP
jgi:acyl-CoA thioester hydrolase